MTEKKFSPAAGQTPPMFSMYRLDGTFFSCNCRDTASRATGIPLTTLDLMIKREIPVTVDVNGWFIHS